MKIYYTKLILSPIIFALIIGVAYKRLFPENFKNSNQFIYVLAIIVLVDLIYYYSQKNKYKEKFNSQKKLNSVALDSQKNEEN
jgi:hypothetical protein